MDVRFYGALGEDLGELVFEEGFGEIGIGTEMGGEFAVFFAASRVVNPTAIALVLILLRSMPLPLSRIST